MLNSAVCASRFGFKKGGEADKAENTAALQAALDAAKHVTIPAVDAVIGGIVLTRTNVIRHLGGVIKLGADENKRMFRVPGHARCVFEDFTIDMNPAQNTGSGSHDAIRFDGASRWRVSNSLIMGAQGWWTPPGGNPMRVGAGISCDGGSGGFIDAVETDGCMDGYVLTNHPDARDVASLLKNSLRCGALIGPGSHGFSSADVKAIGNCTTEHGGAGIVVMQANNVVARNPTCKNNLLGHGYQHHLANDCSIDNGVTDNNGISGRDWYMSLRGRNWGGQSLANVVRGCEIDSISSETIIDMLTALGNGHVDISIFRSKAVLRHCEGNVLLWAMSTSPQDRSSAEIHGGHANETITIMQNEATNVRLNHVFANIVDPGGHVVSVVP